MTAYFCQFSTFQKIKRTENPTIDIGPDNGNNKPAHLGILQDTHLTCSPRYIARSSEAAFITCNGVFIVIWVVIICKSNINFFIATNIMDIKDFARQVKAKRGELDTLRCAGIAVISRTVWRKIIFRTISAKGGFVLNGGLHPWKPARRLASGNSVRRTQTTAHCCPGVRNHLFRSIKYSPGITGCVSQNDVKYAPVT